MKKITYIFNELSVEKNENFPILNHFMKLMRHGHFGLSIADVSSFFTDDMKPRLTITANNHKKVEDEIRKVTNSSFHKRDGMYLGPVP